MKYIVSVVIALFVTSVMTGNENEPLEEKSKVTYGRVIRSSSKWHCRAPLLFGRVINSSNKNMNNTERKVIYGRVLHIEGDHFPTFEYNVTDNTDILERQNLGENNPVFADIMKDSSGKRKSLVFEDTIQEQIVNGTMIRINRPNKETEMYRKVNGEFIRVYN